MERSFIITGIEFLAIVLILLIVITVKGYRECFSRNKIKQKIARQTQKEWKYLLTAIIFSALGTWTLITYFIIKNS